MPPVDRNNPVRAKSSDSQVSFMEFLREYPDDASCLEWLWRTRFSPDGERAECPKCETERAFKRYKTTQRRQSWTCTACGHHIHPTAGTIFHKSSTSLHLWFYAIYLMASTRCGISAKQLERELGVNYKTAWRMFKLIRTDLMSQDYQGPLSGDVEVDETWVGGKMRESEKRAVKESGSNRIGPYVKKRETVIGMVERGGRVVALHVPSRYGYEIRSTMRKHIDAGCSVYTDDFGGYEGVGRHFKRHQTINHSLRIYAQGDVHTQTVEGFFALVKNGIRGVYHAVSPHHLQGYLNEYVWRYNHRDDDEAVFRQLLRSAARA
jgi:transposase